MNYIGFHAKGYYTLSLYYAGVSLGLNISDLEGWWQRYLPREDIQEIWEAGWSTGSVQDVPMSVPRSPVNKVKLNTLYWPTGLSRWAKFYSLVTEDQLATIRTATADNAAATFTISDGITTLTTSLYLLTAYPISKIGNLPPTEHQLYLISLVDFRYFLWQHTGSVIDVEDWGDWFDSSFALLGLGSPSVSIPAAYKEPLYNFINEHKPLPIIIDAAARLLGFRIQVALDGSIAFKDWSTALSEANVLYTALVDNKVAGEFIATEDLIRTIPANFKSLFKATDNLYTEFDKTLVSLAIAEYSGYSGTSGNSNIYYSHYIYVNNASYDPICQALCDQAAYDWYGWQLMPPDITYAGIQDWDAFACADFVQWEHDVSVLTKIVREPFWVSPANTEDTTKEMQVVRIPATPDVNSAGDFNGFIQQYDYIHDDLVDGLEVWVREPNANTKLVRDSKYLCKFLYYPYESLDLYIACEHRCKVHGVLDGDLTFEGSATMSVWEFNSSSEADTTENLTVWDWLLRTGQTVATGTKVTAFFDINSNRWYLDGAQCPA